MADNAFSSGLRHPKRIVNCLLVLLLIMVLLLIAGAVLGGHPLVTLRTNGFLSPAEAVGCYADAGNGLAAAGTEQVRLYSANGRCVAEQEVSYSNPNCAGCSLVSVFYDRGGTGLCALYPTGESRSCVTDGGIVCADVNETGLVSVILEKSSGTRSVLVCESDLTPLFLWQGEGMSPVGVRTCGEDRLGVSCVMCDGSCLCFFRIDSTDERARVVLTGERICDFDFFRDGTAAVVTDRRLLLISRDGEITASFDFERGAPAVWSFGVGFAAVASGSGDNMQLLSAASDGTVLACLDAAGSVIGLSAGKDKLLVLYEGDESALCEKDGTELLCYQPPEGVNRVFLTPNGMAFFAGPGGVTLADLQK